MAGAAPALLWFRSDLRVADHPALAAAAAGPGPVGAFYILEEHDALRPLGGAARWWLAGSLRALAAELASLGLPLLILQGDPVAIVPELVRLSGAREVHALRRYDRGGRDVDGAVAQALHDARLSLHRGDLLHEDFTTGKRNWGVFTPFWKAAQASGAVPAPLPAPGRIGCYAWPEAVLSMARPIESLALEPSAPDWAGGLRETWTPGAAGARDRLAAFVEEGLAGYAENRDRPDLDTTSRLSPHLRFGEITPRMAFHAALAARESGRTRASQKDLDKFASEIGWREFAWHLLWHHPDLARTNYRRRFDSFGWRDDPVLLKAWQRGRTGYPIVDAGMRQLWQTGWLHNRVRMIVASFLIKHLMIDWRAGEAWFWDTLVDADPANNPASWQWVAGSGADAAPFFRIFNPILQGEKFDPQGDYVRRFVPALAELRADFVHKPWEAPALVLASAGVRLGDSYPRPVVDHDKARARALAAFEALPKDDGPAPGARAA